MKIAVLDKNAKKVEDVEIADSFFDVTPNDKVISMYVYSYLANQRQANASTKDRSEVSGGGKKPWRQKGTGRARHGSSRSPIWKGGGVTFGPTSERNYKKKITSSFRLAALKNIFSKLIDEDLLTFTTNFDFDKEKPLTKQALSILKNFDNPRKTLIVTSNTKEDHLKAFANIKNAKVVQIGELNVYDLTIGGKVLLEKDTLDYINNKWVK